MTAKADAEGAVPGISVEDLAVSGLIDSARKNGDASYLIAHLRRRGAMTPAVADLLIDILEGRLKTSPKASLSHAMRREVIRFDIKYWETVLLDPTLEEWARWEPELKAAGYVGQAPQGARDRRRAAKLMVRLRRKLSDEMLKEYLRERPRRDR